VRVGIGYDIHPFDPKRVLVLGGVKIPGAWGLRGPGDGDVLLGAVADALLGAAALGDRSDHFPAGEAQGDDVPSAVLLAAVLSKLRESGLRPAHLDATLIEERPDLSTQRAGIRARLGTLLDLTPEHLNVKATAAPGLGGASAGEGVAALGVVSLEEHAP